MKALRQRLRAFIFSGTVCVAGRCLSVIGAASLAQLEAAPDYGDFAVIDTREPERARAESRTDICPALVDNVNERQSDMKERLISSVAAGALLVGVAVAPMSFAQQTTTPPATAPETQTMEPAAPAPATPPAADEQAQTPDTADKTTDMAAGDAAYLTEQAENQISANTYIGQSVYNASDESIGEINDLIIEKEGGIAAAVVGVGGFLGIGEKNVAVPFDKIAVADQPDSDDIKLTTTETADSLKAAPEFKTKSQLMAERNAAQPVDTSTTSATGTTPAPAPAEPAPQQ